MERRPVQRKFEVRKDEAGNTQSSLSDFAKEDIKARQRHIEFLQTELDIIDNYLNQLREIFAQSGSISEERKAVCSQDDQATRAFWKIEVECNSLSISRCLARDSEIRREIVEVEKKIDVAARLSKTISKIESMTGGDGDVIAAKGKGKGKA